MKVLHEHTHKESTNNNQVKKFKQILRVQLNKSINCTPFPYLDI